MSEETRKELLSFLNDTYATGDWNNLINFIDNNFISKKEIGRMEKETTFQEKYKEYRVNPNNIGYINIGWKYVFPNGYGASVINTGYGSEQGLYEVAVLEKITEHDYTICYTTPITDDVIGWLNNQQVIETLEKIKNLGE